MGYEQEAIRSGSALYIGRAFATPNPFLLPLFTELPKTKGPEHRVCDYTMDSGPVRWTFLG